MSALGKLLVGIGLALVLFGGVLWLVGERGVSFPRLPLDIMIERPGMKFYLPLGTSLLISIILSLIFYLLSRMHR